MSVLLRGKRQGRVRLWCVSLIVLLGSFAMGGNGQAAEQRPFRGSVGMSVFLCK